MRNRNNYMYQRPEEIDPGILDFGQLNLFSKEAFDIERSALGQAQQRSDAANMAIAKLIEESGSIPMSEQDRPIAYNKIQSDIDNLREQIKAKGGDTSLYLTELMKSLSKSRSTLNLAKQRYDEEQKLAPILSKLQAEGKLLWEKEIDPRTQSIFDKEGQYIGGLNYDFREKSDYDAIVGKGVVEGINKLVREGKLTGSGYEGLLQQIQTQGLSALGEGKGVDPGVRDKFVKDLANQFKDEFVRTSTYSIDPKMKQLYDDKPELYIESAIKRLAKDVQTKQYTQDPGYAERIRRSRQTEEQQQLESILDTFGAKFTQNPEDNPYYVGAKSLKEALDIKTALPGQFITDIPYLNQIGTGDWESLEQLDDIISNFKVNTTSDR